MNEQIMAVQRMQEYIEENLNSEISMTDLCKAAMFSPWYARRLFIRYTGLSPSDYIRRLRLSRSALRLRDSGVRIIDAAMDMGFKSVDGYQRAFFKEFGCNPKNYAMKPVPVYLFTPYGVKYRYMERKKSFMENVRNIFIQTVEKPERKAIIKRGVKASDYMEYCAEVGCDVWGLLLSMRSLSGEPVCMWLPEKYRKPGTSEYVQGVEVPADYSGEIPEGFDIISLPRSEYLMFMGEPFEEEDYEAAINEIWEAERKYVPSAAGFEWDESYPRIQLEPVGSRGYIEFMPVKRINTNS